MNTLYLVTGPAGVGKSTISKILATSSKKSCLIEGDDVYHLVVGGYQSPWKKGNHLDLFWSQSVALIESALDFGYDVVFNYIIMKDSFDKLLNRLAGRKVKIKFVLLVASEKSLLERDAQRPEDCQMGERVLVLLREFEQENFDPKLVLNTTDKSAEQTAREIMTDDRFVVRE